MEERVPPATNNATTHPALNNAHEDDDFVEANNNNHHNHHDDDQMLQIVPSSRDESHETYIIQIPKDQIYRVPPPENAEIVERYRRPVTSNNKKRSRCLYWFLSIFLVVAFIVSVIVCVNHFTLSPKPPTFSVEQLVVKHQAPTKKTASPGPVFHVWIIAGNPNKVNVLEFKQGSASLKFKNKEVAKGHFPALLKKQPSTADEVDLALTTSKGGLPKDLQQADNSNTTKSSSSSSSSHKKIKHEKQPVKFNLAMNIPVNMETWAWTKSVNFKVECEVEVESLGDKSHILTQKCHV